jgi:hypothetical protein
MAETFFPLLFEAVAVVVDGCSMEEEIPRLSNDGPELISFPRLAAAALIAVLWKSSVPGVAPPLASGPPNSGFGLAMGNIEPPPPGVNPVRSEDSLGVGKLLKCASNRSLFPDGPDSMAGLSGPALSEFGQLNPAELGPPPRRDAGDVKAATGGNNDFPGVSVDELPKDCSNGLGSSAKDVVLLCRPEK